MPVEVEVPDGIIEFPDSMSESEIDDALRKHYPPPEVPDTPATAKESEWKSLARSIAGQFAQAPIELAQNVGKAPELAQKVVEPIQETGGKVLSDFLTRTGIDPSAMPGRNIVDIPSIEERLGPEGMAKMPTPVKALIGYHDAVGKVLGGFTEPGQASVLPLLGTKPAQALIAAQAIGSAPQVAEELSQAETPSQTASALTTGAINLAIGTGVARHLTKSIAALKESEIPNASEISKATEVHGDMRPFSGEGVREVPVEEGGGGVQSQTAAGVQGSPQGEVLLKPPENVTPPVTEAVPPLEGKGIAASVRNKWSSATDPLGSEAGFINLDPLKEFIDKATPYVKSAYEGIKDLSKESINIGKTDDFKRAIRNWSGKLQLSFGEAADAQKEINKKVPDPVRREGITNWLEADGDQTTLMQRLAATTDPKLAKGYEAALNLTPEELSVAADARNAYDNLGRRGNSYGVLNTFKPNYVTHIWDLGKGPTTGSSRTLRDKFRFSKASTFQTFFEGEQAGYTPKTKDIGKLIPVYLHEMNSVIAARQLVEQLSKGVASDGRPLVASKGGGMTVVDAKGNPSTIVLPDMTRKVKTKGVPIGPKAPNIDVSDYDTMDKQPALKQWTWTSNDSAGNPVLMKGDLAIHPEAYDDFKNILGKSAIREWYQSRGSLAAKIPKAIVQGLDMANSATKRTMLGFFAPFHQVQEGTHAIGHRVNPLFNIPKIDLVHDAGQRDAVNHSLMLLPDKVSADQFMEGFKVSGLVSRLPIVGKMADFYSNYLFKEYIPGLKYKTYQVILDRNSKVYANDLASGKVSVEDVKHLSAEQANAAYGHLNYADLARNPTVQHFLQLTALAPDFFEARARFAAQALKGTVSKVGREQLAALGFLAAAQAATAYTASKLTGGDWDIKHPFEFHVGNRRYSMRSVPEDISSLLNDWRQFTYSRISPIIGKGVFQLGTGVDWRGQKISAYDTVKQLLQQPVPISIRGFLGLGRNSLSGWEQLLSATGLRISRYSASNDVFQMAHDWMKSNSDPKVAARLARDQATVYPESEYRPLRLALSDNNIKAAKEAYAELLKTKTQLQVYKAMSHQTPFTGKQATEFKFVRSLTPEQRKIYNEAVEERRSTLRKFVQLMRTK